MEAIEHHLEFLTKQLVSDEILQSMGSDDPVSPAGTVLQDILSLSTLLARVTGVPENYSELIKGHDLISFTVEMVQNLMKQVKRKKKREREREREREGVEGDRKNLGEEREINNRRERREYNTFTCISLSNRFRYHRHSLTTTST